MKNMCMFGAGLVLAFGSGAATAQTYENTVEANNPLAYFRLDNVGQGSAVNGWTANWDSGVTTGTGVPLASDPGNKAAVFNNNGGITTNVTGISGTAGTLMAWINAPIPGENTETIAGSRTAFNDFSLLYQGSGVQGSSQQRIDFNYGGGSYQTDLLSIANGWHFIAGTFDSVAGMADLYIDGQLYGSSAANTFALPTRTAPFDIGMNNPNFCGTATGFCLNFPQQMTGSVDEVAIFNTALNAGQIANLYAARNTTAAPSPGAVPEPASWAMLITGFGLMGAGMRYRRKRHFARYLPA